MKKEGKMSEYEDIKGMDSSSPCYRVTYYLTGIIEEQNGLFRELEAIRKRRLGYNPEKNKTARKLMELVGEIARKGIKLTEE